MVITRLKFYGNKVKGAFLFVNSYSDHLLLPLCTLASHHISKLYNYLLMSNMKIWLKKKEEKYKDKDKDKEEDHEEEEKILKCNTTTFTCYKVYLPWNTFLILA